MNLRKYSMKTFILFIVMMLGFSIPTQSQEILKEVQSLQSKAEALANDTTQNLESRKIACFKYDAIYYLIDKATSEPLFTEYELGEQTDAMIEFVNYYVAKLQNVKKVKDKEVIKAQFRAASINNSLFNDMDKELVMGYVDNKDFITQFSLDTNWVKAFEEVKK